MARQKKKRASSARTDPKRSPIRWLVLWGLRCVGWVLLAFVLWIAIYRVINPPTTVYMIQESRRLGQIKRDWVPLERIAPAMARSVVAAEDANFCLHWGFDVRAIRLAIDAGATRGASTISQQVVKNAFLWHGRSWIRKLMEAVLTPIEELLWPKRRIIELYLNLAEFDEGVFGVQAAARHYFGVDADQLSATQAARLAAVLPDPKNRSASRPSSRLRRRAAQILDGAATIRADGRAACFED